MTQTMDFTEELTRLRGEIDAIDDRLIALLKERILLVKQIGALKHVHTPKIIPLRPGREAWQVRRVTEAFAGSDFSPAAAAALWRNIITGSLMAEGELRISACGEVEALARDYFGAFAESARHPTARRVIGDLQDGKADIGVLPMPSMADAAQPRWWVDLAASGQEELKIFAILPFVHAARPGPGTLQALAVGRVSPEETGEDTSLIALRTDETASQHRLQTALAQSGLEAQWLDMHHPPSGPRWSLLAVKGFVSPDHAGYNSFLQAAEGAILQSFILGTYAAPVVLEK